MRVIIGIAASVAVLAVALIGYARVPTVEKTEPPRFVDKECILSVITAVSGGGGTFIENPELLKVGDIWYLTGNTIKLEGNTAYNLVDRAWIPLNLVSTMLEYKDADDIRKKLAGTLPKP